LCIVKIPQLGHALTETWSSYMERAMDSDGAEVVLRAVNKDIEKEAMDIVWKICNNEADADGEDF